MSTTAALFTRAAGKRQLLRSSNPSPPIITTTFRSFSDADAPKKKQQKAKKKSKVAAGPDVAGQKNLQLILDSLNAPIRKEGKISEEERQRRHEIGRKYVIGRFRQHNEQEHDLTCKIHLKQHAIKMLPKNNEKLRNAALEVSQEMPPPWRHIPVWTPPIEGFDPTQLVDKEDED